MNGAMIFVASAMSPAARWCRAKARAYHSCLVLLEALARSTRESDANVCAPSRMLNGWAATGMMLRPRGLGIESEASRCSLVRPAKELRSVPYRI